MQIVAWACDRYVKEVFDVLKRGGDCKGVIELITQFASMLSGEWATPAAHAPTSR